MFCRISLKIAATLLLLPALFTSPAIAQNFKPGELGLPFTLGETQEETEGPVITGSLTKLDAGSCRLDVTVTLPEGCYIYSMNPAFASATAIKLTADGGLQPASEWQADRTPKSGFEENLNQQVEKFYDKVTWSRILKGSITPQLSISGTLNGLYCSDRECRPIVKAKFTAQLGDDAAASSVPAAAAPASTPNLQTVTPQIGFGRTATTGAVVIDVSLTPATARPGDEVVLQLKTTVEEGWHIFAVDQDPEMAGIPTEITVTPVGLESLDPAFTPSSPPEIENPLPEITQRVHYGEITWSRRYRVTDAAAAISGSMRFQICEKVCKPPATAKFSVALTAATTTAAPLTTPAVTENSVGAPNVATPLSNTDDRSIDSASGGPSRSASTTAPKGQNLLAFMVAAITAGFVALATPCVFPMIPITVAFFLKQEEKRAGSSLRLAIVYCLSIIFAFTILGLAMARIFGGTSLTSLANNPWLNVFFSILFVVFALMLLGLFEFRAPNWLLNWTAKRESTGGLLGVVFMALTFTLVSFTCTFAFVGSLLVIAAQGDYLWPILGMLGFSTAFASPFFFLALFPGLLKQMPRSGGWMNDVKFIIGLVEIAAVAKFLSVADIGFSSSGIPVFVTYEVFLWSWIGLAAFSAAYIIRRQHGKWPKFTFVRLAFFSGFALFAGRMTAGLLELPIPADPVWNLVAAFAPPQIRSGDVRQLDELGYVIIHHDQAWSLEFQKAVAAAEKSDRPMLVEITGINCVNCRKMERTVLARKNVLESLSDLVRTQLYIDKVPGISDPALQESMRDANIEVASELLGDLTMPSYAIVSPDGKQVYETYTGLDTSGGAEFIQFLQNGIGRWEKSRSVASSR
jgi:thiol:disulfide interchange protein